MIIIIIIITIIIIYIYNAYIYIYIFLSLSLSLSLYILSFVSAARLIASRFRRWGEGAALPRFCYHVTQDVTRSIHDVLGYFVAGARSLARPEPFCRVPGRSFFVKVLCSLLFVAASV